ncbi:SidA/IucD/PvdA family monooxygenase [Streptomyces sp. NPDC090045]|uniref:SidA/IucD/PvdA family monooxygenase n=1 Tax=Streptomyces sp. NPDC090045 TaxID=3365927 RepID=UPI00382B71A2
MLAVGAGPANLAPAVAVEELAPEPAGGTLLIERGQDIVWQRGMLLPDARSQVSFLMDLVTMRNPCSRFSFVNFLHSQERLDAFVNLAGFVPYRSEISEHLQWVAGELAAVKVEYGRECTSVEAVIGAGRDAHVPAVFDGLPTERVIHSTQYTQRIAGVRADLPPRVAVTGGAQSAAELAGDVHARYLRASGRPVIFTSGTDDSQIYVVSSAARAGLVPEEPALRSAGQIRGGLCESCGHPNNFDELLRPRSTVDPAAVVTHRVREALERPLPDFPITYPTGWGIPAPFVEMPGQVLNAWAEGMGASMYCTWYAAEQLGEHTDRYDEHWLSEHGIDLVYFLGFDNVYFWGMTHLALLMAHGDRYVEPHAIVSNEFYELENQKFSTSKGHVVWAADLVAEVPRDLVRFYLALTAPEHSRTNFSREALDTLASDRLVEPWNRLAGRVEELLAAVPVSRTGADHAGILVERFRSHYELESFSLHRAADLVCPGGCPGPRPRSAAGSGSGRLGTDPVPADQLGEQLHGLVAVQ